MFRALRNLDEPTRRITWVSFATLFVVMVAHAILETARDALFLESIPSNQLPWVYLLIAGVSFVISMFESSLRRVSRTEFALTGWLILSGLVTLGFWGLLDRLGVYGLYALYVWTGVLITLAIVQFWTMLDEYVDLSSAKRIYAFVGVGSAVGAIVGSGVAAILATMFDAVHLLGGAAIALFVSAVGPTIMAMSSVSKSESDSSEPQNPRLTETMKAVKSRPYPRRIAALVVAMTITLTLADYVFKVTAAEAVPADQLGAFFGTVYFGLNGLSLAIQLFVVDRVIRKLSITGALAVLPIALVAAGLGFVLIGGVATAVVLKAVDGSMRHSLNRTIVELLYVPMDRRIRRQAKAFIDVLGQRGAQAAASLGILAVTLLAPPFWVFGAGVVAAGAIWVGVVVSIRKPYVDLFRRDLESDQLDLTFQFGDLDVVSLESIVEALNDSEATRVVAALELLRIESKPALIPGLIVWHEDAEVVTQAMDVFVDTGATHFLSPARSALELRTDSPVCVAILAAIARVEPVRSELEQLAAADDPGIAMTAGFYLVVNGWDEDGEHRVKLEQAYRSGDPDYQVAVARAIGSGASTDGFERVLAGLARHGSERVRTESLIAMRAVPHPCFLPILRNALDNHSVRKEVRRTLAKFGESGLEFLEESFSDESLPNSVRWQLPRAVAEFPADQAASVLIRVLEVDDDGLVRYRIVDQLERLSEFVELEIDSQIVTSVCDSTIRRAFELIDWRRILSRRLRRDPEVESPVFNLLIRLLKDKEKNAVDLLIRLLGILNPKEDFSLLRRGLQRGTTTEKVASRELLEHILDGDLRDAVMGLTGDLSSSEQLEAGTSFYQPNGLSYDELIDQMVESRSRTLSALALRHKQEAKTDSVPSFVEDEATYMPAAALEPG